MRMQIEPLLGIGKIRLRMSRDEVQMALLFEGLKLECHDNFKNRDIFDNYTIFVQYNTADKAELIQIRNSLEEIHQVYLNDINIFETKAKDLIPYVGELDSYYINDLSKYGSDYIFKNIGLHLWREDVIHEEDLNQE